jgi:hypothetical protein
MTRRRSNQYFTVMDGTREVQDKQLGMNQPIFPGNRSCRHPVLPNLPAIQPLILIHHIEHLSNRKRSPAMARLICAAITNKPARRY